jgi:hypothetical protein
VSGAGDDPSLKEVLRRMGAYVQSYGEKASIVVATERYTQEVTAPNLEPAPPKEFRGLVADFAIVKAAGLGGWVGYRDVVEVNGTRVSDREDRLIQILTSGAGLVDEAQRLSDESARYNIGPIQRNFNVPTSVLFFFVPGNLDRFKFTRKGAGRDGIWEIGFRETVRPTIVRTPRGASIPAEGSVWVDVETGTIVRTRVRLAHFGPPSGGQPRGTGLAEIDVTYRRIPALDMWLPERMAETYDGMLRLTSCEAKYTDYRQFQTSVRIK